MKALVGSCLVFVAFLLHLYPNPMLPTRRAHLPLCHLAAPESTARNVSCFRNGAFQPFCHNHSQKGTRRQEPWVFGDPYKSVCRKMLKLRQRLIPYLYTLFEECHRTGTPIIHPLLFEYPEDETTYTMDDEFLLGNTLLVAPITRPGIEHRHVYLPQGAWVHFWTGERFEGSAHILAYAPLGEPAIYSRADTALPLWPETNYLGENPADPLMLLLYVAEGSGEATIYDDAGNGFGYEKGEYTRRSVLCTVSRDRVLVRLGEREDSFVPEEVGAPRVKGGGSPPAERDGDRRRGRLAL